MFLHFWLKTTLRKDLDCFMWGECPEQLDQWSCGHRIVLHLRELLKQGLALRKGSKWVVDMEMLQIPEDVVSAEALQALCLEDPNAQPPLDEADQDPLQPPCRLFAKTEIKKDLPKIESHETKVEQKHGIVKQEKQNIPSKPSMREMVNDGLSVQKVATPLRAIKSDQPESLPARRVVQADVAAAERKPKRRAVEMQENQDDSEEQVVADLERSDLGKAFDQALDDRMKNLSEHRAAKQRDKVMKETCKKILMMAEFDFNEHFQKFHHGRLEAGHWLTFQKAVVGGAFLDKPLSCEVCRQIMVRFDIPAAQEKVFAHMLEVKASQHELAPVLAAVPASTPASSASKSPPQPLQEGQLAPEQSASSAEPAVLGGELEQQMAQAARF